MMPMRVRKWVGVIVFAWNPCDNIDACDQELVADGAALQGQTNCMRKWIVQRIGCARTLIALYAWNRNCGGVY